MHGISNNLAISNLQASYDMSKTSSVGSKEPMKTNCNMKQMHQDSTTSASVKINPSSKAVDSNLGANLDIQV